jgi:hypothetical protein
MTIGKVNGKKVSVVARDCHPSISGKPEIGLKNESLSPKQVEQKGLEAWLKG